MCDTLVVVGSDGVLFGKNSDRDPNEAQRLEWHPRKTHPAGAALRCTYLTIPQVRETHAVMISRPFWMWGAEMGTNEHGLCIGNEAVWTTQPYAQTGLTGMDLLRLALERCADAASAVALLIELLDTHGQGGGCGHEDRSVTYHNSFLVADAHGAFVLETAGKHYATERVSPGVRSISNLLTIEPFASQHADLSRLEVNGADSRRACTTAGATGARTPAALMHVLRAHGPGHAWPVSARENGAMQAPCMHAGGEQAASQTTASWVSWLRPKGSEHWATACAAPCTSVYLPVRVEDPLDLGSPGDHADGDSYWWEHERLHRAFIKKPEALGGAFVEARDALQAELLERRPTTAEAVDRTRTLYAQWAERARDLPDERPDFIQRYWQVRNERAGL